MSKRPGDFGRWLPPPRHVRGPDYALIFKVVTLRSGTALVPWNAANGFKRNLRDKVVPAGPLELWAYSQTTRVHLSGAFEITAP